MQLPGRETNPDWTAITRSQLTSAATLSPAFVQRRGPLKLGLRPRRIQRKHTVQAHQVRHRIAARSASRMALARSAGGKSGRTSIARSQLASASSHRPRRCNALLRFNQASAHVQAPERSRGRSSRSPPRRRPSSCSSEPRLISAGTRSGISCKRAIIGRRALRGALQVLQDIRRGWHVPRRNSGRSRSRRCCLRARRRCGRSRRSAMLNVL